MGGLSIWHWLIVLLVVVLIFGTKKLRNMGADLGGAVKGFKEGMKSSEEAAPAAPARAAGAGRRPDDRRRSQEGSRAQGLSPQPGVPGAGSSCAVARPGRASRRACAMRRPARSCSTSASPKSSSSASSR